MTSKIPNASRLASLRAEITAMRAEIEALPAQPLPVADAIARLDAWIAEQAARFDPGSAARAFATERGPLGRVLAVQGLRTGENSVAVDMGPVLCSLFGTEIRERLGAAIQAQTGTPGPRLADRPRALASREEELERLEIAEERLIRTAEAEGEPLARRADATPSIVLAP